MTPRMMVTAEHGGRTSGRADRTARRVMLAAASLAAVLGAGCSGGGASGPSLNVTPSTLSFEAEQGGALPASQEVRVAFSNRDAAYVAAAWADADPGWASIASLGGSATDWTFRVSVTGTARPPATYTATMLVGLLASDYSVLDYREVQVRYTVSAVLTASPPALAFTYVVGGPVPAPQDVAVGGAGFAWTSAAPASPWIHASPVSGTAPATVHVSVDPAGLAVGSHTGTLSFSKTAGGTPRTVEVTLTVEDPSLAASDTSLSFSGVNGTALAPQAVELSITTGETGTWTASADAPWVVLSAATGSLPGTLVVSIDPSRGPLASGPHSAAITVSAPYAGGTLTRVVDVALALTRPTLALNATTVALGGAIGRDLSPRDVQLSLSTGAVAHGWSASTVGAGIALSPASGSVSGAGTTVSIGVDPGTASAGTHAGSVEFSATVNGDVVTATLPVTTSLDTHRLLASDDGVALASMPGLERLSRTLRVRDNFGGAPAWTASTSATWLSAAEGAAADEIVIQANPAGLAVDTIHEATVTIASDDPSIAAETVHVGLWVGSTAPPAKRSVAGAYKALVMDPVRPYAYVHRGGSDIEVYNVFTGALATTWTRVAPLLGALAVSTDGTRLFATDETNLAIVPIALQDGSKGAGWSVPYTADAIVYARTNGRGILFAVSNRAYDVETGTQLDSAPFYLSSAAVSEASVDGTRVCQAATGVSGHDVICHALDYTAATSRLVVEARKIGYSDGYGGDLAMNGDGTRVYHQDGVWETSTMTRVQALSPRGEALDVARDGRIVVASFAPYDTYDVRVRDVDGFVLASYSIAGYGRTVLDAQLDTTGDGLAAAALTDVPSLVFFVIGP